MLKYFLVSCLLFYLAAGHTQRICAIVNGDKSVTFYAGTFHATDVPVGGLLFDGTIYPFTSVQADNPPQTNCVGLDLIGSGIVRWQIVNIPRGIIQAGVRLVSTTATSLIEWPSWSPYNFMAIAIFHSDCDACVEPPVLVCPGTKYRELDASCRPASPEPDVLSKVAVDSPCPVSLSLSSTLHGTSSQTYTVTGIDNQGAVGSCATQFLLVDKIPPSITATANPAILWPPNHKMVNVQIAVNATDNCSPNVQCHLDSLIVSSEPDDGTGDGATSGDWQVVDPDRFIVSVRAERRGGGVGRKYNVGIICYDASGNISYATTSILVPDHR